MSADIRVASLTTFQVDGDGKHARLNFRDDADRAACVVLPVECLSELLMSLPRMVQTALRNRHGDSSLRLVHSLDDFRLELGQPARSGVPQFILTLATTGGFSVSFSASQDDLASLGDAICNDVLPAELVQDAPHRLS